MSEVLNVKFWMYQQCVIHAAGFESWPWSSGGKKICTVWVASRSIKSSSEN